MPQATVAVPSAENARGDLRAGARALAAGRRGRPARPAGARGARGDAQRGRAGGVAEVGDLDGAARADGERDVGPAAAAREHLVGAEGGVLTRGEDVQRRLGAGLDLPRQHGAAAVAGGDAHERPLPVRSGRGDRLRLVEARLAGPADRDLRAPARRVVPGPGGDRGAVWRDVERRLGRRVRVVGDRAAGVPPMIARMRCTGLCLRTVTTIALPSRSRPPSQTFSNGSAVVIGAGGPRRLDSEACGSSQPAGRCRRTPPARAGWPRRRWRGWWAASTRRRARRPPRRRGRSRRWLGATWTSSSRVRRRAPDMRLHQGWDARPTLARRDGRRPRPARARSPRPPASSRPRGEPPSASLTSGPNGPPGLRPGRDVHLVGPTRATSPAPPSGPAPPASDSPTAASLEHLPSVPSTKTSSAPPSSLPSHGLDPRHDRAASAGKAATTARPEFTSFPPRASTPGAGSAWPATPVEARRVAARVAHAEDAGPCRPAAPRPPARPRARRRRTRPCRARPDRR